MNCNDYEPLLLEYVLGDLPEQDELECRRHLESCERCRQSLEAYSLVIGAMADEPRVSVTAAETAALAEALERVAVEAKPERPAVEQWQSGARGFVAACVAAFIAIAAALTMRATGTIDMSPLAVLARPSVAVFAAVVIVFVTSFVPIAVTAKRRPLNGMTFRG